jgi:hypothetical protein
MFERGPAFGDDGAGIDRREAFTQPGEAVEQPPWTCPQCMRIDAVRCESPQTVDNLGPTSARSGTAFPVTTFELVPAGPFSLGRARRRQG